MGVQLFTSPRLLQVTPINPLGCAEVVFLVHWCPFLMGYTEAVSLGKVTQHCHEVRTVSGYRCESIRKHITNHETLKLCGHSRLYSSWHLRLFESVLVCVALRDRTGLFSVG